MHIDAKTQLLAILVSASSCARRVNSLLIWWCNVAFHCRKWRSHSRKSNDRRFVPLVFSTLKTWVNSLPGMFCQNSSSRRNKEFLLSSSTSLVWRNVYTHYLHFAFNSSRYVLGCYIGCYSFRKEVIKIFFAFARAEENLFVHTHTSTSPIVPKYR